MKYLPSVLFAMQNRFRLRREQRLVLWIDHLANSVFRRPLTILDVGGYPSFWAEHRKRPQIAHVFAVNIRTGQPVPGFVVGDAALLPFHNGAVDLVYCNSVIEHIPAVLQVSCFRELCRVGSALYLQTPNPSFCIEPHFCFPFFNILPVASRVYIARYWPFSWYRALPSLTVDDAIREARTLAPVSGRQLLDWSRGVSGYWKLEAERVAGFVKSYCLLREPELNEHA